MTDDQRAKWFASLQTFDKVWVAESPESPGRVTEVLVMATGAVHELRRPGGPDMRTGTDWRGWRIWPLPPPDRRIVDRGATAAASLAVLAQRVNQK